MKINLNKLPYVKPIINRERILSKITEFDIYNKYIKEDIKLKEPISSPFREDNIPSFAIYRNCEGKLLYNDFVLGGGNCFQFVKYLFGYNSWFEVYSRIGIDFWLDLDFYCSDTLKKNDINNTKPKIGKKPKPSEDFELGISVRVLEDYDIRYWKNHGISLQSLKKYNVFPIDYIIFKKKSREEIIKADKYAYAYIEKKDNKISYKIYQPFSKYKWFGDVNISIWQGWSQLPSHSDILIITKSLKDVMAINENCKLASVSLQSEKTKPKTSVMHELKRRFTTIYVLYDNDFDKSTNYGQVFARELYEEYDLINIRIPDKYKAKDYTDLIKKYGKKQATNILSEEINRINNIKEIPF